MSNSTPGASRKQRHNHKSPDTRKTGFERLNGNGTYAPEWVGIRRCEYGHGWFIASTLRADGTELNIGFSSFVSHSFETLMQKLKLIWGEVPYTVDLFCWQEQLNFLGDGL